jgi:hypothetical protein
VTNMSVLTRTNGAGKPGADGPVDSRARPALPQSATPPRLRRRPLLVGLSVVAVCLGALLGAWAYTSATSAQAVVAVRTLVERGQVIERDDLVTVRIGVDPALQPIPATELEGLVGQRAATDLPAGGLVTRAAVTSSVLPAAGQSVVGVALPASLLPGEPLRPGDRVRIVATPGEQGDVTGSKPPRAITAAVVGLFPDDEKGVTVVSVQVPYAVAAEVAALAATGKVAIVLDSRER